MAPGDVAVVTAARKVSSVPLQSVLSLKTLYEMSVVASVGLWTYPGYGVSVPLLLPTQTSRSILVDEPVSVLYRLSLAMGGTYEVQS